MSHSDWLFSLHHEEKMADRQTCSGAHLAWLSGKKTEWQKNSLRPRDGPVCRMWTGPELMTDKAENQTGRSLVPPTVTIWSRLNAPLVSLPPCSRKEFSPKDNWRFEFVCVWECFVHTLSLFRRFLVKRRFLHHLRSLACEHRFLSPRLLV